MVGSSHFESYLVFLALPTLVKKLCDMANVSDESAANSTVAAATAAALEERALKAEAFFWFEGSLVERHHQMIQY